MGIQRCERFLLVGVRGADVLNFTDALMSTSASFETILGLLSSDFVVEDEDALFYWLQRAMEDRRLRRNMNQWREDWQKLVSTGADKDVLL